MCVPSARYRLKKTTMFPSCLPPPRHPLAVARSVLELLLHA
jgi:hypothetical protein